MVCVYNKQRIEYWLRRIDESNCKNSKLIHRFADTLRLAGVGDAKIVNYVQFSYEILKIKDDTDIKAWSREDVDSMALLT